MNSPELETEIFVSTDQDPPEESSSVSSTSLFPDASLSHNNNHPIHLGDVASWGAGHLLESSSPELPTFTAAANEWDMDDYASSDTEPEEEESIKATSIPRLEPPGATLVDDEKKESEDDELEENGKDQPQLSATTVYASHTPSPTPLALDAPASHNEIAPPPKGPQTWPELCHDLSSPRPQVVYRALLVLGSQLELDATSSQRLATKEQLYAKETLALVLPALENHAYTAIAQQGMRILLTFTAARSSASWQRTFLQHQGTDWILAMLKHEIKQHGNKSMNDSNNDSPTLVLDGLGVLCNVVAWGQAKLVWHLVEQGKLVKRVVACLQLWPTVADVQRRGAKVLAHTVLVLKQAPRWSKKHFVMVQTEIRRQKGLRVLGQCLQTFPVDSPPFDEARRAMELFL